MKKRVVLFVMVSVFLLLFEAASAGWGGKVRCSGCSFQTDVIHVGQGKATSYALIRCFNCRNCFQILIGFDEASIRHGYLNPDNEVAALKKNMVASTGKETDPELKMMVNLYPCPRCGKNAREVPEDLLITIRATADRKGEYKAPSCIKCPSCLKKSLFIENSLKWD